MKRDQKPRSPRRTRRNVTKKSFNPPFKLPILKKRFRKSSVRPYGDDLSKIKDMSWITNREFGPGKIISGYTLPNTGDFDEYDHSDYMAKEEFFEKIHGHDVAPAKDTKISDEMVGGLQYKGEKWHPLWSKKKP